MYLVRAFVFMCFDIVSLQEEMARMNNHPSSGRRGITRPRDYDVRFSCVYVLYNYVCVMVSWTAWLPCEVGEVQ